MERKSLSHQGCVSEETDGLKSTSPLSQPKEFDQPWFEAFKSLSKNKLCHKNENLTQKVTKETRAGGKEQEGSKNWEKDASTSSFFMPSHTKPSLRMET